MGDRLQVRANVLTRAEACSSVTHGPVEAIRFRWCNQGIGDKTGSDQQKERPVLEQLAVSLKSGHDQAAIPAHCGKRFSGVFAERVSERFSGLAGDPVIFPIDQARVP